MAQGSTTTKVTATDLDVRDLTSVSDSVSAVQSGTWNVTNISGTVSLPTGAATSAKQDTGNTSIASVDTNLTALTKAEDAAHSTGDKGIQSLSVRSDTATALSGTDGDYQPLITDGSGRLHVNVGNTVTVGAHAVTNAGTFAVQNTAAIPTGTNTIGSVKITDGTDVADVLDLTNSNPVAVALVDTNGDQISSFGGGTQYTEDAAAAANPVGTVLNLIRDDALSGSLTTADGDNVAARGNNKGEQYVKHTDPIAVTQSGTWDEVGINDSGNSITVDYATTGSGTATGAIRVELPTNGTGVIATVGAVTAITNALPAGTNAIGKLSANSGVDIGDVDVASVIPGTGATNLGKAIDTATGATDTGVLTLATRDDALSTLTPVEGDNVQLRTDSTGALWVKNSGTVTVDGSAVTQPVSNAGLTELAAAINSNKVDVNIVSSDVATGGTSAIDDADFTATSTSGTPAMGVYESTPTSVTDGDMGIVGITAGRRLKTSATIDTALPAGTNAIGKLSANSGVDIGDVDVTSISAGDNTIGRMKLTDGTTVATVRELGANDALNVAMVDGSGNQITSFGGGTEYTEDVATANPIVGKAIMIERDDALTTVTPVEGDNIGLRGTAEGALWTQDFNSDAILADTTAIKTAVEILDNAIAGSEMQVDIVSSALPTGASTLAEQQSQTTHLATIAGDTTAIETAVQLIDDTVATLGTTTYTETSTKGLTIGAVRRDADTTLVDTTNEIGPLQMNAAGQLKVEVFSGETLPVSMTSTTVTGTVAVTQSGTWDEVGINDSGNSITVDNGGTFAVQVDGSALTSLQLIDDVVYTDDTSTHSTGSSKGNLIMAAATPSDGSVNANDIGAVAMTTDRKLHVSVQDALPAGTNAIGKLAANSGVDIGDTDVTSVIAGTGATNIGKAEDAGHTTADTGVFVLGVRNNTPNTAVTNADADYTQLSTDMVGGVRTALYETDFAVLGTNHVKKYYTNAGAVTDGIVWSPASGKRWYVTDIFINVSAACTVTLEDDKAGGDEVVWKSELAANSGWSHRFGTPLFSGEDAADLLVTTSAGNIYITITGYEI